MNIAALRERIDSALQQETEHGSLATLLAGRIDELHRAIRLPGKDAPGALLRFVRAYIGEVPAQMEAVARVAVEAGLDAQIEPALSLAEQFLPPSAQSREGHDGLETLLAAAYLAHRLVEEINDRYIVHFGQPQTPFDTTVANLIAHRLLGESFANRLDAAVQEIIDTLIDARSFAGEAASQFREKLANAPQAAIRQHWPCLAQRLGIELQSPTRPGHCADNAAQRPVAELSPAG